MAVVHQAVSIMGAGRWKEWLKDQAGGVALIDDDINKFIDNTGLDVPSKDGLSETTTKFGGGRQFSQAYCSIWWLPMSGKWPNL